MIPLADEQAEQRIRRARQDRDKRRNHDEDYYKWLSYHVFITNVAEDTMSAAQIAEVYKVRWQIELLFKAWKSSGNLQTVLHEGCTNVCRVKTIIYLMLMFFCLVMQHVYVKYFNSIVQRSGRLLSIIKLLAYVRNNLVRIMGASPAKLMQLLVKNCSYELRNDRINMIQFIYALC